jgi:hypothetical protein
LALQAFDVFNEAMADAKDRLDSKKYAEAQATFTSALSISAMRKSAHRVSCYFWTTP